MTMNRPFIYIKTIHHYPPDMRLSPAIGNHTPQKIMNVFSIFSRSAQIDLVLSWFPFPHVDSLPLLQYHTKQDSA